MLSTCRKVSRTTIQAHISLLFLLVALSAPTLACIEKPLTELEAVYCKIKAKGKGQNLPAFQQFRQNAPSTQALLLKQPARKLGIDLPKSTLRSQASFTKQPVIQSKAITPPPEVKPQKQAAPSPHTEATRFTLAANCTLLNDYITCGHTRYELQINLSNKHLNKGALSSANKLRLPARNSANYAGTSEQYYLSQSYVAYIEKMVEIGLADATMSFTKFVATHDDIKSKGGNFPQRFTQMYELLKKEKLSNAVKGRYNNLFPDSINACMQLSRQLIVCDNVTQNWVYRAED